MDLGSILSNLVAQYPILASILMAMGILRAVFKPIMTAIHAYVLVTPNKADDELFNKVESSKAYNFIVWLLDYVASIKVTKPDAPKVVADEVKKSA